LAEYPLRPAALLVISDSAPPPPANGTVDWKSLVREFQKPSRRRATWQLANTLGTYVLLWALMSWSLPVSSWLTLVLAVLNGGIMVRAFIIFHDCGHGSFFPSRRANDLVGFITGMLTFTSYGHWRWEHALHHASSGDLDRRGTGDVWTMTVQEYLAAPRWQRFFYRLSRNPVVLFGIAPALHFFIRERFPAGKASAKERRAIWRMNAALAIMVGGMCWVFGWKEYLLIQLVIYMVGGAIGVWMFYVQHQFEGAYWDRGATWDYTSAALQGSSYYHLPRVLQWFTGNIGFHHIHHLSPRIPNYNLERCHRSHPIFREVKALTLRSSLQSIHCHLWDEPGRKLVSFRDIRALPRMRVEDEDSSSRAA
jgi:omega-6 fatty acid desaturase (delta-12 desaturase)